MKKRILSLLLTILMIISLVPSLVYAQNDTNVERYTVLVLDTSGKQKFYWNNSLIYTADTAVSYVKQASTKFVNDVLNAKGNNKIAVVQYNSSASVVSEFSDNTTAINQKINALSSNNSSCCIAAGLEKANQLLSTITNANVDKNIVLVTTGFTNSGQSNYSGHYNSSTIGSNWENMSTKIKLYAYANVAYATAETIKESSTIYTLGLFQTMDNIPENGKDVASFFKLTAMDLATSPSHFYEVDDPNNLEFTFDEIVDSIINPLQLDLSYNYVNIHPGIGEEEGCVEIEVWAKITNTSSKESINTLVRLKETPGLDLVENETLEHNLGNIPANESRETYWTLRAATPDGEKDYVQSVVVGSENSVAVERSLTIKITGNVDAMNFDISDRWGFSHGSVANYNINTDDLNYLLTYYSDNTIRDMLRREAQKSKWGGSCYGMSLSALLFKLNRLTPEYWDLRYDRGDSSDKNQVAENIIELYTDEARSLINYYHIMQDTPEHDSLYKKTGRDGTNISVENIVSSVKDSAVLLCFSYNYKYKVDKGEHKKGENDGGGHAIILYGNPEYNDDGWNINGEKYRNRIKAYDVNCLNDSPKTYFFYDKFINYRWTVAHVYSDTNIVESYYETTEKKLKSKSISMVSNDTSYLDFRNLENKYVEEKMVDDSTAYLKAYGLTNKIRLMDTTGRYVDIDGLVTNGEINCITYYKVSDEIDGTSELNVALEEESEYTILNTENVKNLDFNMRYNNTSLYSKVSNANEITFNPQGKVDFNGENSSYELSLVANDGYYSTPWYKTTISGNNANDITMEQVENGVVVDGDNLSDVKITTTDDDEKSQVISTDKNKVLLTSNIEEDPIIMIDSDDDGTYDKQLETYTLTVNTTTGGEIVSEQVEKYSENAVVEIEAKANSGYTFTGWTSSNGGTFEDANSLKTRFSMPANDTTITANFKKKSSGGGGNITPTYTVVFETNGGSKISNMRVRKNNTLIEPAEPTKDGFAFKGWYTDKEMTEMYNFSANVMKDFTLYAKWEDAKESQIILTIGKKEALVFGETRENDVAPKIVKDRTMLPIRFIAEALGAEVDWDDVARKVTIIKDDIEIVIIIDSNKAIVNGKTVTLDSPAFIENDRTYLPLRFVSENLGAKVAWVENTQQVIITK